jgi:hypothetical protein
VCRDTADARAPRNAQPTLRILFSDIELTADGQFLAGLQTTRPDGTDHQWVSVGDEHQADWGTAPVQ